MKIQRSLYRELLCGGVHCFYIHQVKWSVYSEISSGGVHCFCIYQVKWSVYRELSSLGVHCFCIHQVKWSVYRELLSVAAHCFCIHQVKWSVYRELSVDAHCFCIHQVKWSVYREFLRAVGWAWSILIVGVFALYHVAVVVSDIFLSQWTDDRRLNNVTLVPPDSEERASLNRHYLALYGGFGAMQGMVLVVIVSFTSHARIGGEGSTKHFLPALFFFLLKSKNGRANIFHFLGKVRSTLAQRAETSVGECSPASCV